MKTRLGPAKVVRLSKHPRWFKQSVPKWGTAMERCAMDDEKAETATGGPGGLPAEVLHRIGLRILAGLTGMFSLGVMVTLAVPVPVAQLLAFMAFTACFVFVWHMVKAEMSS